MRAPRLALCSIALVAVASVAGAQATPKPATKPTPKPAAGAMSHDMHGMDMKAMHGMMMDELVGDLERQRKNLLDYVNVAPDSMLGFRSTPGVRTYAQQIEHASVVIGMLVGQGLGNADKPAAADTARIYHDKAALAAYVNSQYDFAVKSIRGAQPQAFMTEREIFGMKRDGTQWVRGALEHATWTLGQTVPYLRMNGVTPPSYLPF